MENQPFDAAPLDSTRGEQDKTAEPQKPLDATRGKPRIAKIMIDRNLCIGAASCIAVAPSTFELDPENKAVLRRKTPPPSSDMTNREDLEDQAIDDEMLLLAAKSCPTQAIIVFDEEGNQLYP